MYTLVSICLHDKYCVAARNGECTICMEDFTLSEEVRCLPCMHMFHSDCIVKWLQLVSLNVLVYALSY